MRRHAETTKGLNQEINDIHPNANFFNEIIKQHDEMSLVLTTF